MPDDTTTIDITDAEFARRLARLLIAARESQNLSTGQLARASDGEFTRARLVELEAAESVITADVVESVAMLYMADLGEILPTRVPVVIRGRTISAGGLRQRFDPHDDSSLLESYLLLVRALRQQKSAPDVALRRDDIEVLGSYLRQPAHVVLRDLASLMGATRKERTTMLGLFGNGAVVIGLAGFRFS